MGARGPAPKPTALKIIQGNPGRRPLNKTEPKPKPIAPKCPDWLDKDAKAEWKRISPELESLGLLTGVDMATLAGYCQSYSHWKAAEALIVKVGILAKTGSERYTSIKPNPAIQVAQSERTLMLQFGARLGLSPSDRGRMTLPQHDDADQGTPFDF